MNWPTTPCAANKDSEHTFFYADNLQRERCRCGAVRGVEEVPAEHTDIDVVFDGAAKSWRPRPE